jgi:hypothetical protein
MGFKSGHWLGHSRPFTFVFWSHSSIALVVCLGLYALSCWNRNPVTSLKSFVLWSRFSSILLHSLFPLYQSPSPLKSIPIAWCCHHHASGRDGVRQVMNCAWFSRHSALHSGQRISLNHIIFCLTLCLSRAFLQTQGVRSCAFFSRVASVRPHSLKA